MAKGSKVVVTGAAGFIGMHLIQELVTRGYDVYGIDNFRPSYGGEWCHLRAKSLSDNLGLEIKSVDLSDFNSIKDLTFLFADAHSVIHLAAWPGVRQGQIDPYSYMNSNLTGFSNVMEAVRIAKPRQVMFASSSSVYGEPRRIRPIEEQDADGLNLRSLYASTKWANEILAAQLSQIYGLPMIALRFFTVYGEFGRPDMAYWTFLEKLLLREPIQLYGESGGKRNFTYVKDAVRLTSDLIEKNLTGMFPVNLSIGSPFETRYFLDSIAKTVGVSPTIQIVERPSVDVSITWGSTKTIESVLGTYTPTGLDEGISQFTSWYLKNVKKI